MNRRVRTVIGAGAALAVVAAIGIGVANTSTAASARYVTAIASTGDVTQTYTATGSITRKNSSTASFSVSGTVKSVAVAVGDEVDAGDTLATLNKGALQLAVLNAETSVAQAEATLYAAKHPTSSSSSSKASSASKSASSGSGGATAATILIDPVVLNEAVARVNLAILTEGDKCNEIFDSILPSASSTATPTATSTATDEATESATPTATESATATSTPDSEKTTASEDKNPVATATASQLASILDQGDFTDEQLQACADARAEVIAANTNLQTVVAQLTGGSGSGGSGGKGGSSGGSSKSSSSSSSSTVSKSAVAKAKASLLSAEQDLATAKQNLSDATLVAPISGTVGTVGLTAGDSSSGSITIVGEGSAVVTFELPLTTRELVKVGQSVTVTPAGSTKTLTGKITAIASLETSGTSGDTPTYSTTVSVTDKAGLLATGAKASVSIPVKAVTGVVRVPASAVTPTGTGTATVQVVDNANATTATSVTVKTGAVGGGWVQITDGLEAGKIVVLADNTADIPSNTSNQRTTRSSSTSSSSSSAKASAAATAVPTASGSAVASAAPTASASR